MDFLFRQLTEIAVRALSPGINDPFTAIECLDRLTAGFRRLAGRERPSPVRRDDRGEARVTAPPQSFARMARLSLGSIRHYGQTHEEVLRALLHSIAGIAAEVRDDEDHAVLSDEVRGAAAAIAGWTDDAARRRSGEAVLIFRRRGAPCARPQPGTKPRIRRKVRVEPVWLYRGCNG
ncbi:MAG: DUF2254 family protein [Candidatus Solibacter sp.]